MTHVLDAAGSEIVLRTGTSGLFSAVAHDLEIAARSLRGEADFGANPAHGWLECPVRALAVVGVVKRGRVETNVLSASDRSEIERRIRDVVLRGESVRVEVEGEMCTVTTPRGSQRNATRWLRNDDGGAITLSGETSVSLQRIGVGEVKGPLGAFRVADEVKVRFRLRWIAPG